MKKINGIFYPDLEDAKNATCEVCHYPDCDGHHAVLGKGTVYFQLNEGVYFQLNEGVYYGLNKGGKMKQFLKDNYDLIAMIILTLATIILGLSWIWE